ARKYSQQQAYPDQEFPFTGDDARCVLCQQRLDVDAGNRLTAFEKFIKDDTQQVAELAEAELTQALDGLSQSVVGHAAFDDYLPDLPEDQDELRRTVRLFHGMAWRIRRAILNSCADGQWRPPSALPASPVLELDALIGRMLRRAEELDQAAGENERQALVEEQNELLAREWVGGVLEDVSAEIRRKKGLAALDAAAHDTVTTGITLKSSELTDMYVTDVIRDRLTVEIKALGAEYLGIELDFPGARLGHQRFKVS
ncbi:unnamed protein product, partial [marine sediment metagenome]